MDKDQIIKWVLIAVGGYLVYKYVIEPMMNPAAPNGGVVAGAGAGAGASSPATTGQTSNTTSGAAQPQPGPSSGAPSSNPATPASQYPPWMASLDALAGELQTRAGSNSQSVDQWAIAYDQLRGLRGMAPLTGDQVNQILSALGLSLSPENFSTPNPLGGAPLTIPSTRLLGIPASRFVQTIFDLGYGLQGLGMIVPVAAQSMSFGGGVNTGAGVGSFGRGSGAAARFRGFNGKGLVN